VNSQQQNNISLIILAGGKSSRIGTDKALLKFQGKTFIQTIYDNLKELCSEVIISSNNPKVKISGAKIVTDKIENIGPAGGIFSALSASQTEKNMIVSVDTPFIPTALFEFLIKHNTDDTDVLIISEETKQHPLIGMYSKKFSQILSEEIKKENYKIRDIIKKTHYRIIDISEEHFYRKNILQNINTEDDYNSAIEYMKSI